MTRAIDLDRVAALHAAETERFIRDRPASAARLAEGRAHMPLGVPMTWMDWSFDHPPVYVDSADGAYFTDVDGHRYLDMYLGITVAAAGHTQPAVIDAVTQRMRRGIGFGLPTDDAIAVSRELAARWGLPKWQFALTSSQAITDVVRLARIATGREQVLVFEGKYHGHVAELLAIVDDAGAVVPEYDGITATDVRRTRVVDWNDLAGIERELETREIAAVIAEPALTNSGIVFPQPGFHAAVRTLTRRHGTVLAVDETQTLPLAFGGLTRAWGLEPDAIVVGKSLGGGVPVAAFGLSMTLGAILEHEAAPYEVTGMAVDEPATGGTTFGNALSMAAARAALEHVWTPATYERTAALASRIAAGMRDAFREAGLDWDVYEIGNRAGYRPHPVAPRNNTEAGARDIPLLRHAQRVYMANRGIFEFGWWCGPAVSAQATGDDIEGYVDVFRSFVRDIA
jgi:glutamate-1-semialdehyde 2,1-aminomutase